MSFTHLGLSDKVLAAASVSRIRRELDQCEVVCVNCHRHRTHRRASGFWRSDPSLLETKSSLSRGERRNLIYIRNYLLRSPCIECGEGDVIVLDFDHRQGKVGGVVKMARDGCSLDKLMREVDKCEVRCGNCHRRRTLFERRRALATHRNLARPS